ncbi:ORF6N domain-containing protein [Photorhabdus luminescens]|uniref:ORF6N domain-containing protein n=1 Tax=Photorhabdus luminescens TaxID=29488 RepID=UPI00223F99F7|nr:ORF6N domain-containing protein [Photorhabdus luminescens]MCW7764328.1 ORF6N domain-containing protein [Photorhabdus luminescens subsp. venezuelensis]
MFDMNVANQGSVVTYQDINVPLITYQDKRVITTELLAKGYGTNTKHIQQNFTRNEDRFTEGKHYFHLEGEELKAFKNLPSLRGVVDKRAPRLVLWTERGASRHAKMLETDQAWDYYEILEETYFRVRSEMPQMSLPNNYIEALESLLKSEKEKAVIAAERDKAIETKAWIGHKREATAMATASIAVRERNKLADLLGQSKNQATILTVEKITEREFKWQPLKKWCKENNIKPDTVPDKRFGTVKSWPAEAWLAVYDIDLSKLL